MAKTYAQLLATLNDIDAHVEHVAISNPANSDLNILAHAIHNIDSCLREMIEQAQGASAAAQRRKPGGRL